MALKGLEKEEKCCCGGDIDCMYPIEPNVWYAKCFVCGVRYTVIKRS